MLTVEGESGAELRRYGTLKCIQLCDAHHRVQRLEEETALLEKELAQYINYCAAQVATIIALLGRVRTDALTEALSFAGLPDSGRYFCASAF